MRCLALLGLLALPGCTSDTSGWIIYAAPSGDVALGTSANEVPTLTSSITQRQALVTPPAGTTTFTGGVVSTRMTWAQFAAGEGVP